MRLALGKEPRTLDWVKIQSPEEMFLLEQFQRSLLSTDATKKEAPELAEAWSVDASQKRFIFSLGKHFWSDGVELTADDFVHAWERHLAPGSQSRALPTLLQIRGAADFHRGEATQFSVRATSGRTLEVELEKPSPTFLTGLTSVLLGPQRRDVFSAYPDAHTTALHLRTIGPYQPFQWAPGESMLLVFNSYFPGIVDVARVRVFFAPNKEADIQLDLASGKTESGKRVVLPEAGERSLKLQAVKWR